MTTFKYLRHLLNATDDDWIELLVNLQKARKIWSCLSSIFGREGADAIISGCFYLTVFQAVLLF